MYASGWSKFATDQTQASRRNTDIWVPPPRSRVGSASTSCAICLDDDFEGKAILCRTPTSEGCHSLCATCLCRLTLDSAQRTPAQLSAAEVEAKTHRVCCPVPGCGRPYGKFMLQAALKESEDGRKALAYLTSAQLRLIQLLHHQSAMSEIDMIRAQYRKPDGSYDAFMCGNCGYGPIEKFKCDDLQAHHGEQRPGAGLASISNACPACGWFKPHIRDWPRWDGRECGVSKDAQTGRARAAETFEHAKRHAERQRSLDMLLEMGFRAQDCAAALRRHGGSLERAANELAMPPGQRPSPPPGPAALRRGAEVRSPLRRDEVAEMMRRVGDSEARVATRRPSLPIPIPRPTERRSPPTRAARVRGWAAAAARGAAGLARAFVFAY